MLWKGYRCHMPLAQNLEPKALLPAPRPPSRTDMTNPSLHSRSQKTHHYAAGGDLASFIKGSELAQEVKPTCHHGSRLLFN